MIVLANKGPLETLEEERGEKRGVGRVERRGENEVKHTSPSLQCKP
jgi:hypothetical protein